MKQRIIAPTISATRLADVVIAGNDDERRRIIEECRRGVGHPSAHTKIASEIAAYIRDGRRREHVVTRNRALLAEAAGNQGWSRTIPSDAAEALSMFHDNFGRRELEFYGPAPRLSKCFGELRVTASADLFLTESGQKRIIKLHTARGAIDARKALIVMQVLYFAARRDGFVMTPRLVQLFDVRHGHSYACPGIDEGAWAQILTACEFITQVWAGLRAA
jgi:hypothetical protein